MESRRTCCVSFEIKSFFLSLQYFFFHLGEICVVYLAANGTFIISFQHAPGGYRGIKTAQHASSTSVNTMPKLNFQTEEKEHFSLISHYINRNPQSSSLNTLWVRYDNTDFTDNPLPASAQSLLYQKRGWVYLQGCLASKFLQQISAFWWVHYIQMVSVIHNHSTRRVSPSLTSFLLHHLVSTNHRLAISLLNLIVSDSL